MKNTDLADGIHEDVSSDLTREAGPGGKKQPWPMSSGRNTTTGSILGGDSTSGSILGGSTTGGSILGGTTLGGTGGALDQLGGAPKLLGSDASKISGDNFTAGASSAAKDTDFTDSIHEDASKGIESIKGATSRVANSTGITSNLPQLGEGSYQSPNVANTASGVLDRVRETVSGVFGGHTGTATKTPTASAMDAGASAAIKSTDLTDGVYEDAGRGIESVVGATARRS